ncbi:MAG: shikimate kinase, partial [Lautropia sp.]
MYEDSTAAADDSIARRVCTRVRSLRGYRDWTRAALAEHSGVSVAYLARLEGGTANISLQVLGQLAAAFGVAPSALLDAPSDLGPDYDAIVEFARRQSPAVRAELRRTIVERWGDDDAAVTKAGRIALIGLRGAGKSTLGERLARRFGLPFVELNREIEREGGVAVAEVFTLYGAAGYRTLERSCLKRVIERHQAV